MMKLFIIRMRLQVRRSLKFIFPPFFLLPFPHFLFFPLKGQVFTLFWDIIQNPLPGISILITAIPIVLSLYDRYWGRTNLHLDLTSNETNWLFTPLDPDGYEFPSRCSIHLSIINLSNMPVSITEFHLKLGDSVYVSEHLTKADDVYHVVDKMGMNILTLPVGKEQILPPTRLQPQETKTGFVFFVLNECCNCDATLTAVTPQKNFSVKVHLSIPYDFSSFKIRRKVDKKDCIMPK